MRILPLLLLISAALLSACSSNPGRAPGPDNAPAHRPSDQNPARKTSVHGRVVLAATGQLGTPYRYGGASPEGFDCSGLVYYSFRQAGRQVPRTTGEQYRTTRRVKLDDLSPGDLLFFRLDGKPSHVGIYVGDRLFVHAPSSGKYVSYASLEDDYWRKRLTKAGRF